MKRAVLIFFLLTVGFSLGWVGRDIRGPAYPDRWDKVKLGMTAAEAHSAVPGLSVASREAKGFDQEGVDYGDRYWNLLVSYNPDEQVEGIEKKYVDRRIGTFNRSIVEAAP